MGIIWSKIFPPKEDNSAAVKKQAEGASNPMYALASLVRIKNIVFFRDTLYFNLFRLEQECCMRCARRP